MAVDVQLWGQYDPEKVALYVHPEMQPGDQDPVFFSTLTTGLAAPQVACGITHTNAETHQIIRENLDKDKQKTIVECLSKFFINISNSPSYGMNQNPVAHFT